MQIVKNLLSNAMKFTAQGSVRLHVGPAMLGWSADHPVLSQAKQVVEFSVTDTGIGISPEKQTHHLRGVPAGRRRHRAQVRRHGPGARDLARARAPAGRRDPPQELARARAARSRSICRWPTRARPTAAARRRRSSSSRRPRCRRRRCRRRTSSAWRTIARSIEEGDSTVLIVEDEPRYAKMLLEAARGKGFKVLVAQNGADALSLARKYQPSAVTLDVFLPDMLGWTVLNQLKHDPATRHIPVQVLTVEEERQYGLERGAFSFMTKPSSIEGLQSVFTRIQEFIAPRVRELLVIEDDSGRADEHRGADRRLRHPHLHRRQRRAARSSCCANEVRLRDPRSQAARRLRFRAADARSSATSACATFRSWCSPAASSRTKKNPSCASARRASCSRACRAPSACSTRRRCSCIAGSATCRKPSSA